MKESQEKKIYNHLRMGKGITALFALKHFACMRLAARISDLRKKHPLIKTEMVEYDGSRYARYTLKSQRYEE
tara:strand:- start:1079 stop:1294 length:216 start_codon:yes stop_codon:yes gene_type:complete